MIETAKADHASQKEKRKETKSNGECKLQACFSQLDATFFSSMLASRSRSIPPFTSSTLIPSASHYFSSPQSEKYI